MEALESNFSFIDELIENQEMRLIGRNLHLRNPESVSTRALETLVSYFGHSSENEIYGNRRILCEYAGVDSSTLVFGRIQHGWVSSNNQRTLIKNDLVDTYVWSNNSATHCTRNGLKRVTSIGSTWLYFLEIAKRLGWTVNGNDDSERSIDELWIYGAHSTKLQTGEPDHQLKEFLEAANNSNAKLKRVLLFYIDYHAAEDFIKNNYPSLKVITALGSRLHSASADSHLFNIFWILNDSKRVILDVPTTALLYAITMGCKVSWYKNDNYHEVLRDSQERQDLNLITLLTLEDSINQQVMEIVNRELGLESMKSPKEIRDLFRWGLQRKCKLFLYSTTLRYFLTLPSKIRTSGKQ